MFADFLFGQPYFGQPIPQGGAVTGSGTLIQQNQAFNGTGTVTLPQVQTAGGGGGVFRGLSVAFWNRFLKRQRAIEAVRITGLGVLCQKANRFNNGRGHTESPEEQATRIERLNEEAIAAILLAVDLDEQEEMAAHQERLNAAISELIPKLQDLERSGLHLESVNLVFDGKDFLS